MLRAAEGRGPSSDRRIGRGAAIGIIRISSAAEGGSKEAPFASKIPEWGDIRARLPLNKRREVPPAAVVFRRDESGSCPLCQRVWLALLEKGVQFREEFTGEGIPSIKGEGGEIISGWMECLTHLEHRYPEVPLLPTDAGERRRALDLIKGADAMLLSPDFLLDAQGSTAVMLVARDRLLCAISNLESTLCDAIRGAEGDFLLGGAFSLVDCVFITSVERHAALLPAVHPGSAIRGNASLPLVNAWLDAVATRVPGYAGRAGGDAITHLAKVADAGERYSNALQVRSPGN